MESKAIVRGKELVMAIEWLHTCSLKLIMGSIFLNVESKLELLDVLGKSSTTGLHPHLLGF